MDSFKGVFHTFIACKLRERNVNTFDNVMKRKDVCEILGRYNVPINIRAKFLIEMESFKLIELIDKNNVRILYEGSDEYSNDYLILKLHNKGLSQTEIAERLGMSNAYISKVLKHF